MAAFSIGGVTVDAPSEYTVKMVVFTAPMKEQKGAAPKRFLQQERSFLRNLVVAREDVPEGTVLADYAAKQAELLAQQLPGFKKVKSSFVTISGTQCPLLEAQGSGPEGMAVTSLTTYFQHGNVIYTLSASNMTGLAFQDTKAEYQKIFESFTVTK